MTIKTWESQTTSNTTLGQQLMLMQNEIDELRTLLVERDDEIGLLNSILESRNQNIETLTGVAFLAGVERDDLRKELGDLPQAQTNMMATIKEQRKVLEQALSALTPHKCTCTTCLAINAANTAIQEILK